MNEPKIRIEQYEQAADEKVSMGGIKWLKKWDVKIQCDSREEADRVRDALASGDLISRKEAIAICLDYHRAGGTAWDCWNALLPR